MPGPSRIDLSNIPEDKLDKLDDLVKELADRERLRIDNVADHASDHHSEHNSDPGS